MLTVVTGVAGSGKSSLIHGNLTAFPDVVMVDQSPIRGSRRSSPATYTGLLDVIRSAFAKANDVKPGFFSANSQGACPECKGLGVIITELGFNSTVESRCEVCDGTGFNPEALEYKLDGKNIHEVLSMSASEAGDFFPTGPAHATLARLIEVGLGYITLGQALSTLSGGERQRLKLAISMAKKGAIYVLDEPTSGMHLADVENLLGDARPAGGGGQQRHRHRAPPGGDGARRLDHRPGSGRGARRRAGRLRGHAGRPGGRRLDAHRRAPGGVRRRVSGELGALGLPEPPRYAIATGARATGRRL